VLLALKPQLPWEFTRLGNVRPRTLDAMFKDQHSPPSDFASHSPRRHAHLPAGHRNTHEYEMLFGRPRWGTIVQLERSLAVSPLFRRVFRNRDGEMFTHHIPQEAPTL
jgi:hypothetical protein